MDVADTCSSSFYFSCGAPIANYNPRASTVSATVANRCPKHSVASATLASVLALSPSRMLGHVMPSFPHTLIGLGPFTNQGCKIVLDKTSVTVYHPNGHPILNGWQDLDGPQLWKFLLTVPPPLSVHLPPLAPLAGGLSAAMSAFLPHPSQGFRATSATRRTSKLSSCRVHPLHDHGSPCIKHFLQPSNAQPPQHWCTRELLPCVSGLPCIANVVRHH
jgi:hypothetical protein